MYVCLCVCMCVSVHVLVCVCVFVLNGGTEIATGLCGLMTSRSVNWPTWLFPCNADFHM